MGKEIQADEVSLILEKLYSEATPVTAYYQRDHVKVMKQGVVSGVSTEHGITIADDAVSAAKDYIAVAVGFNASGVGWTFWYRDARELGPEHQAGAEMFGDTALAFYCPDGGRLILYFSL